MSDFGEKKYNIFFEKMVAKISNTILKTGQQQSHILLKQTISLQIF